MNRGQPPRQNRNRLSETEYQTSPACAARTGTPKGNRPAQNRNRPS